MKKRSFTNSDSNNNAGDIKSYLLHNCDPLFRILGFQKRLLVKFWFYLIMETSKSKFSPQWHLLMRRKKWYILVKIFFHKFYYGLLSNSLYCISICSLMNQNSLKVFTLSENILYWWILIKTTIPKCVDWNEYEFLIQMIS